MLGCTSAEDVLSGKLCPRCEGARLTPNAQQPYELGQVSRRDRRFEGLQGREYWMKQYYIHVLVEMLRQGLGREGT